MKITSRKINLCAAITAVCLYAAFSVSSLFAIDGKTVIQGTLDVKEPAYSHSLVRMDLIEKDGSTESRVVEEYGRNKDDLTDIVMIFKSPASVKDTRFLQKQNANTADDKWIYLPALKSTRRVASSEGSKSFMGTDATYDDMNTRNIDDDAHELIAEESKAAGNTTYDCYKVKSTPVNASSSQYSFKMIWVDKKTMLPVYTEMYDKKGSLLKILTVESIQNVNGYDTPMVDFLQNVQTGHSTRLVITNIEVDKTIPDRVFTSNFLNTGK